MKILVNLIGEQPIPNLLPALYLKPEKNIILYTDKTSSVAKRLHKIGIMYGERKTISQKRKIEAYNINSVINTLVEIFNTYQNDEIIFNITGGTKLMSIGMFNFAAKHKVPVVYLKSEKNKNILYTINPTGSTRLESSYVELPELLTVDLYLRAHLWKYRISKDDSNVYSYGLMYENAVINALRRNNFEVIQNVKPAGEGEQVEIDAVFRLKGTNNVAIAEIKVGDYKMERPKKGIDQLSTAGSREYLGIYTKKYLITARKLSENIKAAANAHNVIVIDRIKYNKYKNIIFEDSEKYLIDKIIRTLN